MFVLCSKVFETIGRHWLRFRHCFNKLPNELEAQPELRAYQFNSEKDFETELLYTGLLKLKRASYAYFLCFL